MKLKNLDEQIDLEEAFGSIPQIDESTGVIKNVVLLTGNKVSKNRTKYTENALTEAVTRYEGAKMYIDHPRGDENKERRGNRSVRDLGGVYRNVHRDGDRVRADLHVFESFRPILFPIAKARPAGTGLSIRDRGRVSSDKDNTTLVEGFQKGASYSVDFVTEASLNEDLFESSNSNGGEVDMDIKTLTKEELAKARPDLCEAIQAEAQASLATKIEEATAKGEKADATLLEARKVEMVAKAGLAPEVMESVKKLVMKPGISLADATEIVESFKATIKAEPESKGRNNNEPRVRGHGARVEESVELPSDDVIAASLAPSIRGF